MVGSAVRHEQRAIPRLVWQTWRTNQLPPALFAERESHAAYFLQEQDMTRYDAVNFVSHGLAKSPGMSRSTTPRAWCEPS